MTRKKSEKLIATLFEAGLGSIMHSMIDPMSPHWRARMAGIFAIAAAYFASSSLALILTRFDGGIAVMWPASALLFAKLLASPRRRWGGLALACAIPGMCASQLFGFGGVVGVGLPLLCILEALAGAFLMRRSFPRFGRFASVREVAIFIGICGFFVPMLSAIGAAGFTTMAKDIGYWQAWRDWYAGHSLGLIIFGPPLILLLRGDVKRWARGAPAPLRHNAFGLFLLVLVAALAAFGQDRVPLVVVPFLPMIAATLRLGRFGAVVSILILIVVGLSLSLAGHGPTALLSGSMALKLQVLQIYFASTVLLLLPLAAELYTRRRVLERLHAAEALHRLILDRMSDVVLRAALDGSVRYASPSAQRMTGYRVADLIGRPLFNLIIPDDLPHVLAIRREVLSSPDESAIVEYRIVRSDGAIIWIESHVRALVNAEGSVIGTLSIIREVTERRHFIEDLRQQAMTDPLTGACNRRAFDEALEALLSSRAFAGEAGCLALFDLDHFKQINDEHGHAVGDEVLINFVALLRATVRDHDLVARLGGEEFAVILVGLSLEQAKAVCERVRKRFEANGTKLNSGRVIPATVSVGMARLGTGISSEKLLSAADDALYRSKRGGRNQSSAA